MVDELHVDFRLSASGYSEQERWSRMWILPFPENLLCRFLLFLIQAQLSVVFYKPLTFRNPVHFLTFDFYKTFFF